MIVRPTIDDYKRAGQATGVDPMLVRAIASIESAEVCLIDGRPVIRFEPHKFRQFTSAEYAGAKRVLDTLHKRAAELGPNFHGMRQAYTRRLEQWQAVHDAYKAFDEMHTQGGQWRAYQVASGLHPVAAAAATSWGAFQVMGFNARYCGFADNPETPVRFAEYMARGAADQLRAFERFVMHPKCAGLLTALRAVDYPRIAHHYNGSGYRRNRYDEKLEDRHGRFRAEFVGA